MNLRAAVPIKVAGGLYINGTKEKPVHISASAGGGSGGILVTGSPRKRARVEVRNTLIENLGNFPLTEVGARRLNGAVTFYNADILIEGLVISGSGGEDAINLIGSTARIRGLDIEKRKVRRH